MRGGSCVGSVVVLVLILILGGAAPLAGGSTTAAPAVPSALAPHAPIVIQGNGNFTAGNGVVSGSGTPEDPYRISGWDINTSAGPGIRIADTTAYFAIDGVAVHGLFTETGISLSNVSNGAIVNSNLSANADPFWVVGNGIRIEGNVFVDNHGVPDLSWGSDIVVSNNTFVNTPVLVARYISNLTVDGNLATDPGQGVLAWNLDGFRMTNNRLLGLKFWGFRLLHYIRNFEISNNTVDGSRAIAVELGTSSNGRIANNTVRGSVGPGIYLTADTDTSVERNYISGATEEGIRAMWGSRLRLLDNNVSANAGGIHLDNVQQATVSENLFYRYGLNITGDELADFATHTIPDDNMIRDVPIRYRANAEGLYLHDLPTAELILANVSHSTFERLAWPYGGVPVQVAGGHDLALRELNVSGFGGVDLRMLWTTDSMVDRVNVGAPGTEGAYFTEVRNLSVGNSSFAGNAAGLHIETFQDVTIRDSTFRDSGNGTVLAGGARAEVSNSSFVNNYNGLVFSLTNTALVDHNGFSSGGGAAILVFSSNFLTVSRNNVSGFLYGARLQSAQFSFLYHNAFWSDVIPAADTGGAANRWNDTYPSGGNFWALYAGVDVCGGPNQDVCTGPDGIGDTPYVINGGVMDYYPLMVPYGSPPVPPQPDYVLYGSALAGWGISPANLSNPGPTLSATAGRSLSFELHSVDGIAHTWFLDLNNNSLPDVGEPISESFDAGHPVNFTFTPAEPGTFAYRCSIHLATMWGMIVVASGLLHTELTLTGDRGLDGWFTSAVGVYLTGGYTDFIPWETHYRIDGGAWITYLFPIGMNREGVHFLEYYSNDSEGNVEPVHNVTVRIDLVGPLFAYSLDGASGENGWFVGPVLMSRVNASSAAMPVSLECRVDGVLVDPCGPFSFPSEGMHTVSLNATDAAGLSYRLDVSVGIDTTPPTTELGPLTGNQGPDGWWVSGVLVSFGAGDMLSGLFETFWRADGGAWNLYSQFVAVTDGVHVIEFYSRDVAGNLEPVQSTTLYVDTNPPEVTPTVSGPLGNAGWYRGDTTVSLNATDSASGVASLEYLLDHVTGYRPYASPLLLTDGVHDVRYRAYDAVGYEGWGNLTVRVDGTPPVVQIGGWATSMTSSTVALSWTGTDAASGILGYSVSVDDGPWTPAGTRLTLTLADGAHTVRVRADDVAGNSAIATAAFRIDTNPLSPSGPFGPWLLVGIVAAGFGVGLVTAALVVRRRKRLS